MPALGGGKVQSCVLGLTQKFPEAFSTATALGAAPLHESSSLPAALFSTPILQTAVLSLNIYYFKL